MARNKRPQAAEEKRGKDQEGQLGVKCAAQDARHSSFGPAASARGRTRTLLHAQGARKAFSRRCRKNR